MDRPIARISPRRRGAVMGACIALAAGFAGMALAEDLQPAPNPEGQATAVPAPAPAKKTGLFAEIGEWIDSSIDNAAATLKGTRDATSAAGAAAKNAVEAMVKLPSVKVVSGREACETGATGTPDCRRAVEALCQSKGWSARTSLEIQSVHKCPVQVWASGREPGEGECRSESYVLRAWCE